MSQGVPGALDVLTASARQTRNGRTPHGGCNRLYRFEIAIGSNRKSRFDHIDLKAFQLLAVAGDFERGPLIALLILGSLLLLAFFAFSGPAEPREDALARSIEACTVGSLACAWKPQYGPPSYSRVRR